MADTTTLQVTVQNSSTILQLQLIQSQLIGRCNININCLFLRTVEDEKYEVIFGAFIHCQLCIVTLSYVVTNGADSNVSSFSLSANRSSTATITTASNSSGGADAETPDSIRFNAQDNTLHNVL